MRITNTDRAIDALKAANQHSPGNDDDIAISDLLCDLRHAADLLKVSWDELLDRGDYHYQAEIAEEAEDAG